MERSSRLCDECRYDTERIRLVGVCVRGWNVDGLVALRQRTRTLAMDDTHNIREAAESGR